MAASTGPALWPSTSTWPGTGVYPGQGNQPIVRCRISTDDYANTSPKWQEVAAGDLRDYSTSRGRANEQQTHDAGTATAVIDNRDRAYDPNSNAAIVPMNRVWLYEEFSGEVHDLFVGYADSWTQGWPGGGWSDAVVTVTATDEFKVLAMQAVPTTNPPRGTYEDLVGVDAPDGYWRLSDPPAQLVQTPSAPDPNPPDPYWRERGKLWGRFWGHFPD